MNSRENFISDISNGKINKSDYTFAELAKMYKYPKDNGANLCKKDYYKVIKINNTKSENLTDFVKSVDINTDNLKGYKVSSFKTDSNGNVSQAWYKSDNAETLIDYKNEIVDEVSKLLNTKIRKSSKLIRTSKYDNNQLFFISDLHVGMKVDDWDLHAAQKRVNSILNYIDVDSNVSIILTGDIIDGLNGMTATTSSHHKLPQNLNNSQQLIGAVSIFKNLFDELYFNYQSGTIKSINFISTSNSNHSGDMDLVIAQFIELYLNKNYPEINCIVTDEYWNTFNIDDYNFVISHGKDSVNMKNGLPLVLDNKTELYLTQFLVEKNIKLDPIKTHVITGDLHTESLSQGKFFKYHKLPAVAPASDWVKYNFGNQCSGIKVFEIKRNILSNFTITF